MNKLRTVVSCAGTFESNASILRALAVARWYEERGVLQKLAIADTPANRELAARFGLQVAPALTAGWRGQFGRLFIEWLDVQQVHLINVSVQNAFLAVLAKLRGARVIADWDEWASKIPAAPTRKVMWRSVEELLFRVADAFVVASRFLESELWGRLEGVRVCYIPYGYDPHQSPSGQQLPDLPDGTLFLAYVGSFTPNYAADIDELVRAAGAAEALGMKLLIIGDGVLLSDLKKRLSAVGLTAHFLGRMLPTAVDRCLLHRAVRAGFLPLETTRQNLARCPNKLFHYIRANLPVVTSRIGEASEALGDHGAYYQFGDHLTLREALVRALVAPPRYEQHHYTWSARLAALAAIAERPNAPCLTL